MGGCVVNNTLGTVSRVAQMLRCLAEHGEDMAVSELAALMGLAPSSVHRLLHLLRSEGLVHVDATRHRYRIGTEFFRIASLVMENITFPKLARPLMAEVVDQCNEVCLLSMHLPASGNMTLVEKVDTTNPLRYVQPLFRPRPLAWGASGRAILAFLPPAEIDAVLAASGPSPVTDEPLPGHAEMHAELARVRQVGYAITHGQKIPGAVGMSAPIFDAGGRVAYGLCLTVPEHRFQPADEPRLAEILLRYARKLSHIHGHTAPAPRRLVSGGREHQGANLYWT